MDRIGVRELRQNASRYLERVKAGETVEVTQRGQLVAFLVPASRLGLRDRLIAGGLLVPGNGERVTGRPLPPSTTPSPSEVLADMRRHER
jgi:prevent-host-death family protein